MVAKILAVDDDPSARDLLVAVLGYAGHQVREAADGVEALAVANKEQFDLIIADLLMPTMDGFEFVRRLRENPAFVSMPVVFYTATYLESEARTLAKQCGVSHIITKPAESERILQTVGIVLGMPQLPVTPPAEEFRQKHPGLLPARLARKADTVVSRLDAIIELGLQFASERDPQRLLNNFCAAARKIIGAKYATVGVLDKDDRKLCYLFTSGMSPEIAARISESRLKLPESDAVLSERRPRRLSALSGNPKLVGLPKQHPPVHSFLSAPIISPDRVYGWLCLADKIGSTEFNEEDEGLAQILAAQVGRIYENASLYSEIKRYVAQLEAEIAERKQAQEQVRELNNELEGRVAKRTAELHAANEELEAFTHSVSHDLRAPLRAVGGFSKMLLQDFGPQLPDEGKRLLNVVTSSADQMRTMIDNLLKFSRLGRQALSIQTVNVSALVHEVIEEFRKEQSAGKVDVRIGDLPKCKGDQALLKQVFVNLLSNAIKFSRKKENPQVEVGCQSPKGETIYFVRDNGAGFDMRFADKLFGVFQRLHDDEQFEGTGVGLSIVDRIIKRHGGKVWADAEEGKGATFYITVPE